MSPLLLAAALAAAVGLGWLEWRRRDRALRGRRIAAAVAAVVSLVLLAVGDSARTVSTDTAVVATEGATPSVVRHLADSTAAPVYLLDRAGDARAFGGSARPTADLASLLRAAPSLRRLVIAGWGLDSVELAELGERPITFVPAPVPPGIATIRWPGTVPLGGRLTVRGTTVGVPAGTPILLVGPQGVVDSGRIAADSTFVLETRPPAAARLRYALRIPIRGVVAETAGVAVVDRAPPRILVLDHSPSFESRYLEDWMRDAGGALAIRTEISRGRYRTRYLNSSAADLNRLSGPALRSFDVVVLGTRTLAALQPPERAALESAVRDEALGVVLRAEAPAARGSGLLAGFSFAPGGGIDRIARVGWAGDSSGRRAVGLAPLTLQGDAATRTLAVDSAGNSVAAWRRAGAGAVAVTLVATPSRWRLGGESERFAAYWSLLLGTVSRPPVSGWEATGPAMVDRPLRLVRFGPDTAPAVMVEAPDGRRDSVFLSQDLIVPSRWEGSYWPRTAGWHRLSGDSLALDFDVAAAGWRTLEATDRERTTAERAAIVTASTPQRTAPGGPRRIPPIVLFVAFVGATAVLWSSGPR